MAWNKERCIRGAVRQGNATSWKGCGFSFSSSSAATLPGATPSGGVGVLALGVVVDEEEAESDDTRRREL